jgi:hypothetical protein
MDIGDWGLGIGDWGLGIGDYAGHYLCSLQKKNADLRITTDSTMTMADQICKSRRVSTGTCALFLVTETNLKQGIGHSRVD